MAYVYECGPPEANEIEPLNIVRKSLSDYREVLLLTSYGGGDGRTKQTDFLFFVRGAIICFEMKYWLGKMQVPNDRSDWLCEISQGHPIERRASPIHQTRKAEQAIRDRLENFSGYNRDHWHISSAVLLTHPRKEVSFVGTDNANLKRVIVVENFYEQLQLHMDRFHPRLSVRQRSISNDNMHSVMSRLNVPYDVQEEYMSQFERSREVKSDRHTPANNTSSYYQNRSTPPRNPSQIQSPLSNQTVSTDALRYGNILLSSISQTGSTDKNVRDRIYSAARKSLREQLREVFPNISEREINTKMSDLENGIVWCEIKFSLST